MESLVVLVLFTLVLGVALVQHRVLHQRRTVPPLLPAWSMAATLHEHAATLSALRDQMRLVPAVQREIAAIQSDLQQVRLLVGTWSAPGGPTDRQVLAGLLAIEL